MIGFGEKAGPATAARINGTASHALDFDDVNSAMQGHPTVPVASAIMALAQSLNSTTKEIIEAFVAGYEIECRLGAAIAPDHYDRGFHTTGTLGTFGAAAACARLHKLSVDQTVMAFGIAATSASGLKSMFGTMCKPLHVGLAAENGLRAARLASQGFISRDDAIECVQGFAATQTASFRPEAAFDLPESGYFITENLFKYHAACYLTHSSIEALQSLVDDEGLNPSEVEAVEIHVDQGHLKVCGIEEPTTGLEAKFSLTHTAAMAILSVNTSTLASYTDEITKLDGIVALRGRIEVCPRKEAKTFATDATVRVKLHDGRLLERHHDVGVPERDIGKQWQKLEAKCVTLVPSETDRGKTQDLTRVFREFEARELGDLFV